MKRLIFSLTAVAAIFGCTFAEGQTIRQNPGFRSQSIPANDDGSTGLVPLGFTINFFGKLRSACYVNNNGNLTFDSALATFTPFGLLHTQREIIAPFFADVDTRAGALVTYGQDTVNGHRAFGANYINVGYYSQHVDKLNSFQVVLVDRSDTGDGNFDIEFNYARITWETGDASGGVNGFGGTPATVGWSNGSTDFFELPGSMSTGQFLDGGPRALVRQAISGAVATASTSARTPGRITFRARDGIISLGPSISNGSQLPDATLGTPYSTSLTVSGGATPPYKWTFLPDVSAPPGLTFSSNGVLSGVPTTTGTYSYTVGVTANSEDGEITLYQRGSITINPAAVSILTACPLADATVGSPFSVTLRASGGSGYVWTVDDRYSLPPGVSLSAGGLLAGTPLAPGTYLMNFRVRSSGVDGSQPAQTSCRINVMPSAVRLTQGCSLPNATVNLPYSQILSADGGFSPYRFRSDKQLPVGLALTDDGTIAGTPLQSTTVPFTLSITDSRGVQTTQSCSLTVDPAPFSVASACPLPSGLTGSSYHAELPSGYTWSLVGTLPAGLTLSPEGVISGSPMAAAASQFRLIATDSSGRQVGQPCSLAIARGPVSVTGCPLPDASAGEFYSVNLGVAGGSGPYYFTAAGSLPDGISLSLFGLVSGTPATGGSFPFTVTVQDPDLQTTTQACSLAVKRPLLRIASTCPLPSAQLGAPYTSRVQAAGGTAPYRFDFLGFLPDGLQGAADGTLSGTPQTLGGQTFVVRLTDAQNQSVSSVCSMNVGLPKLPQIRLGEFPATVPPAASNLAVTIELSQSYTAQIDGQVALGVEPDTRASDPAANQADPRVRFANGQATATFSIAPGATRATLPLFSTGTVASSVIVSLNSLHAAGVDLTLLPTPKVFRIAALAPVVTSACYTRTPTGIEVQLNGYSTTRELVKADVVAGTETFRTDLTDIAAGYFAAPETIRAGGTFSLKLPYQLNLAQGVALTSVSVNLSNTVGAAGNRSLQVCQ